MAKLVYSRHLSNVLVISSKVLEAWCLHIALILFDHYTLSSFFILSLVYPDFVGNIYGTQYEECKSGKKWAKAEKKIKPALVIVNRGEEWFVALVGFIILKSVNVTYLAK